MSNFRGTIRRAAPTDAETLAEFNCRLAFETESKKLDRDLVGRGVKRAFEQGDEAMYFVAEDDAGVVIGSLMLTREWSDWRDGWMAWLQSVYVHSDHRNQGVFRALLNHAKQTLRENPDVRGLRLYVENENLRAQDVYLRSGFTDPSYRVLEQLF